MTRTVADYLLERLREWDVDHVFGYPGDGINGIIAALGRADDVPRFVQARHEEMAAFEGWATPSSAANRACAWRRAAPAPSTCGARRRMYGPGRPAAGSNDGKRRRPRENDAGTGPGPSPAHRPRTRRRAVTCAEPRPSSPPQQATERPMAPTCRTPHPAPPSPRQQTSARRAGVPHQLVRAVRRAAARAVRSGSFVAQAM